MSHQPEHVLIYHITDVANLPGILAEGGLHSDVAMAQRNPTVIGYTHIKERRMKQIRVACCGGRFVGEFVPFYYCPRSPMLFISNKGNTGHPAGCQRTIVHLVSTVAVGIGLNRGVGHQRRQRRSGVSVFLRGCQSADRIGLGGHPGHGLARE